MSSEAAQKAGGGAMSTRDELAASVQAVFDAQFATSRDVADALIAEGWRKRPGARRIAEALHADDCPDDECEGGDLGHYERQAELVLALMDRGQ